MVMDAQGLRVVLASLLNWLSNCSDAFVSGIPGGGR